MKIRVNKAMLAAAGVAVAVTVAGGVAVGAGADDWYSGGNATLTDPDHTGVALKLYNASGVEVTTGSVNTPIAAFAAAGGAVRAGDSFATLFVHLPESDTAPGAWPGLQVTGTDRFSGGGAVVAPAALDGKPYVRTTAEGYSLSDVTEALPNDETSASFAGVYELRLRTSSTAKGVSTEYAAAYVKVSGSTWTVTTAPVLGSTSGPSPTSTTTTPPTSPSPSQTSTPTSSPTPTQTSTPTPTPTTGTTVKKKPGKPVLKVTTKPTPKKAGAATVTVATPAGSAKATGKVSLVIKKGKSVVKVSATLKAGTAKVKLPKLAKGSWTVTITYAGDGNYLPSSAKSKVASK